MKAALTFILLATLLTVSLGQTHSHGNGRPDCNDPYELTRLWRNNWDPNSFFQCEAAGQPATLVRCTGAFIESQQRCGDWADWVWQTPFDPPFHN